VLRQSCYWWLALLWRLGPFFDIARSGLPVLLANASGCPRDATGPLRVTALRSDNCLCLGEQFRRRPIAKATFQSALFQAGIRFQLLAATLTIGPDTKRLNLSSARMAQSIPMDSPRFTGWSTPPVIADPSRSLSQRNRRHS
jgi:hypothetical protein